MCLGPGTLTQMWVMTTVPWLSLFQLCVCWRPWAWGKRTRKYPSEKTSGHKFYRLRRDSAGHRDMNRQATE